MRASCNITVVSIVLRATKWPHGDLDIALNLIVFATKDITRWRSFWVTVLISILSNICEYDREYEKSALNRS